MFTPYVIQSKGMESTLCEGDRIIVNKWSYGLRLPLMSLLSYHRLFKKPVHHNDIVIFNNPSEDSLGKSIDCRATFIGRCIGIPGDTLMLDETLLPVSQKSVNPDYKSLYSYPRDIEDTLLHAMKELGITNNPLIFYQGDDFIRRFSSYEIYLISQKLGDIITFSPYTPLNNDSINPFIVPAKGKSISIHPWNIELIKRAIAHHEGREVQVENDTLVVDGQKIYSYMFTKDYYWMASNNAISLNDSRLFGFVPEDHIIGKAFFVWFSKDREAGIFEGFRWNRFFQKVN